MIIKRVNILEDGDYSENKACYIFYIEIYSSYATPNKSTSEYIKLIDLVIPNMKITYE